MNQKNEKQKAFEDFEIFEGKQMSDLLRDIYNNSQEIRDDIKTLINKTSNQLNTIDDIAMLMPVLKDCVATAVKNDKQLIDLGALIQKLVATDKRIADGLGDDNISNILTDQEKKQLREMAKTLNNNNNEINEDIKELENEINKHAVITNKKERDFM
jgi:gas vesicle protein